MDTTRDEVDTALLAEAERLLGTRPGPDTLNAALAAAVAERRRLLAVETEAARLRAGHYAPLAERGRR